MQRRVNDQAISLAREWRMLGRVATAVALLTSPALFFLLYSTYDWPLGWALLGAFAGVVIFRGGVDVIAHKMIPSPALYGAEDALKEQDVVVPAPALVLAPQVQGLVLGRPDPGDRQLLRRALQRRVDDRRGRRHDHARPPRAIVTAIQLGGTLFVFMLFNFLILFGPLVIMGILQIKTYEPGDADWGVKLDDVRGQVEAKEEITRVVSLWQSGEEFEKAGGKRERGVLFMGPPGTGKTMLSKAIATSFNCPFVTIPGSGFAQTFIGMDAVIVRFLARKAKKRPPSGAASASSSSTRSTPSACAARRWARASSRCRPARCTTRTSSARWAR